ncbi:Uncharacterised protein [Candidatus Anstonella stagnisolia]|nr:Uncharacterised protein [Candidatus Anstonella stagnisolia]
MEITEEREIKNATKSEFQEFVRGLPDAICITYCKLEFFKVK